jgi:hypothetical protein
MKANEELLNAYTSDEFKRISQEATESVEKKIEGYIGQFREHVDSVIKEVESKDFSHQLIEQAKSIDNDIAKARKEFQAIADIVAKMNDENVSESIANLKLSTSTLESQLNALHGKASLVGDTAGRLLGSGIKMAIQGITPF